MMTRRRHGLLKRLPPIATEQQSHVAPRLAVVQPVQTVARAYARFAPGTLVEIDLKRVLLARLGTRGRNQPAIAFRRRRAFAIVPPCETLDRSELLLFCQQFIDQRPAFV
jgi:hypothetical protein